MEEEKLSHQSAEVKLLKDRRLANEQKYAAQALTNTQGWSIMREYIQAEIDRMITEVIDTPLQTTFERQEYLKGMIKAYKIVLGMPQQMIAVAEGVLETLPPEDETDDEAGDDAEYDLD